MSRKRTEVLGKRNRIRRRRRHGTEVQSGSGGYFRCRSARRSGNGVHPGGHCHRLTPQLIEKPVVEGALLKRRPLAFDEGPVAAWSD